MEMSNNFSIYTHCLYSKSITDILRLVKTNKFLVLFWLLQPSVIMISSYSGSKYMTFHIDEEDL